MFTQSMLFISILLHVASHIILCAFTYYCMYDQRERKVKWTNNDFGSNVSVVAVIHSRCVILLIHEYSVKIPDVWLVTLVSFIHMIRCNVNNLPLQNTQELSKKKNENYLNSWNYNWYTRNRRNVDYKTISILSIVEENHAVIFDLDQIKDDIWLR